MKISYPQKENICFPVDLDSSPHHYYSKISGWFYRKKLSLLCDYLPKEKANKILEVGYGSGILLKELSKRFNEVHAIDVHGKMADVKEMLKREKIDNVFLHHHDIFSEPFHEQDFDFVISSSVLEHIPGHTIKGGVKNMSRCLRDGGELLLGFPLKTKLANLSLFFYQGFAKRMNPEIYDFSVSDDHVSGQNEILPAVEKEFSVEHKKYFLNRFLRLYLVLKGRKHA